VEGVGYLGRAFKRVVRRWLARVSRSMTSQAPYMHPVYPEPHIEHVGHPVSKFSLATKPALTN
jgi:hypothetical protein